MDFRKYNPIRRATPGAPGPEAGSPKILGLRATHLVLGVVGIIALAAVIVWVSWLAG